LSRLSELTVYLKKKGLKETISRIKSRYFSITEFVLFRNDLNAGSTKFREDPDIEYRLGDMEELKQYRIEHPDLPREFYIDQTHEGKEFYLGYYKGELAQICWVFRRGDYSRFFILADDASCELNYVITLPEFRGKGFSANISNYICNQLVKEQLRAVVVGIAANNILMIKGMKNTDFYEFKKVDSWFSFVKRTVV